jgi:transcriptional regulator with XRE-family HTH domain
MLLSDRIRKIREAYNLTQGEVAEKMGISPSTYGEMERNAENATFQTLSRIAESIGVSLLFLIDTNKEEILED